MIEDIYWVCVLYNTLPAESLTLISLARIFERNITSKHNILIYDNSPVSTKEIDFFSHNVSFLFHHNPENPGLAVAYNCALQKATGLNKKWLVLLDQDTVLESDFLLQLIDSVKVVQNDDSIVAIIPKVYSGQSLVSPSKLCCGVLNLLYKDSSNKKISSNISAINSGSAISVDFLNFIYGFNEEFSLDLLDHWLFHEIFLHKKSVFLNSASIQHSMSVELGPVSCQRYKSILLGERKLYCDIKEKRNIYTVVLLLRTISQLLKGRFQLAKMTMEFLVNCHAN